MTQTMIGHLDEEHQAAAWEIPPMWADPAAPSMPPEIPALGTPEDWQELLDRVFGSSDPGHFAMLVLLMLEQGESVGQAAWTAQVLMDGGYDLDQARSALTCGRGVRS